MLNDNCELATSEECVEEYRIHVDSYASHK